MLDAPFSEEEVWNTIKLLSSDKAPGSDGFTGRFYKVCWPIIKEDIMTAISAVWQRDFRNIRSLNSAYVTLLMKMEGAVHTKDFRPISLIHSFAKLVTKILRIDWLSDLKAWSPPTKAPSSKGGLFRTIVCLYNKRQGSCTHKNSQEFCSSWILRKPLVQFLGVSSISPGFYGWLQNTDTSVST
jgi:hypothetical protein